MGERAARLRPLRHALLVAVAGVALLAGCAVGPAEDEAALRAQAGTDGDQVGVDDEAGGSTGGGGESGASGEEDLPEERDPETALPTPDAEGSADAPETVAEGLDDACCVTNVPGTEDVLVGSRSGEITRVTPGDEPTPVGQVPVLSDEGQGELLDLALDPAYEDGGSGWIVVSYNEFGRNQVARFGYTRDQPLDAPSILARELPLADRDSGGALAFGSDGMLYVATGGVEQADDSVDPTTLAGKILRLDPDRTDTGEASTPDSRIYSVGYPRVRALAADPDRDGLWAVGVTDEGAAEITLVPPTGPEGDGANADPLGWEADDVAPVDLAYVAGSLWVPAAEGPTLWRLPLDGVDLVEGTTTRGLALRPEAFTAPTAVLAGQDGTALLVLAEDGTLTRYRVE